MDLLDQLKKKLRNTLDNLNPVGDTNPNQPGNQNVWTTKVPQIAQSAQQAISKSPIGTAVNNVVQNYTPFANPTSNNGRNFWSSPVGSTLAGQTQLPKLRLTPLSDQANKIQNPVLKFGAQAGIGVAEDALNMPRNIVQTPINIARDVNTGVRDSRKYLADAAPLAEGMLNIGTLGGGTIAKGIAKQGFKLALKQAVKEGSIQGGKFGAAYGGFSGLETGRDIQDPKQYAWNVVKETAKGAGMGAALGGGVGSLSSSAGEVFNKVFNAVRKTHPNIPEQEAKQKAMVYIRDASTGRYAGVANKKDVFIPSGKSYPTANAPLKIVDWRDKVSNELGVNDIHPPQPGLSIRTVKSNTSNMSLTPGGKIKLKKPTSGATSKQDVEATNKQQIENLNNFFDNLPESAANTVRNYSRNPRLEKIAQQSKGRQRLKLLFGWEKELAKRGYSEVQIKNVGNAAQARKVIENNVSPKDYTRELRQKFQSEIDSRYQAENANPYLPQQEWNTKMIKLRQDAATELQEKKNAKLGGKPTPKEQSSINNFETNVLGGVPSNGDSEFLRLKRMADEDNLSTSLSNSYPPIPGSPGWNQAGNIIKERTPIPTIKFKTPNKTEQKAINTFEKDVMGRKKPSKIDAILNPVKNLYPEEQEAFMKLDRGHKVSQVEGDIAANTFKTKLDPNLEWKLVQYSQKPTATEAKELGLTQEQITKHAAWLKQNREFNDKMYQEIKDSGTGWHWDEATQQMTDINYLGNHIYQKWKQTPEEIEAIGRGLGKSPANAKKRWIPTFREGMAIRTEKYPNGLTPAYTTFGQLNGAMAQAYHKAKANKEFIDTMTNSGSLAAESEAPMGWEPITAKYFPKAEIETSDGTKLKQTYYARPDLAKVINNYFGGQPMGFGDKIFKASADIAGATQNLVLSGGFGPLNFFGLGQVIKEGTAMRVLKPLTAFARSYSRGASKQFEVDKAPLIKEMASQGIPARGVGNYQDMYKNVVTDKNIFQTLFGGDMKGTVEKLQHKWHEVIDEPTFGRLLNQLQISFYEDSKNALLKKGYTEDQAIKTAAEATKKFYGITDVIGRAQGVDNILTSAFLAPKYRESMINIYGNIASAFKPGNLTKEENRSLQKLAFGAALTYGMANVAQMNLTGNYMWDNPPGKEFEIVFPVGDPKDKKYLSVPIMPGFTAMPRRVLSSVFAAAKGDIKESAGQAGSLLSIPLGMAFELFRNKDYFGNEIIRDDNQLGDAAAYVGNKLLPGYGRAISDVATGKATPAFGVLEAMELPVRKGAFPNPYFKAQEDALKRLPEGLRPQAEYLTTSDKNGGPDSTTEANMMLGDERLLDYKKSIALASNPNDPLYSRPNEDIKAFLAYRLLADDGGSDTQRKAQIVLQYPWIPQVQLANSEQMYNNQQARINPSPNYDPNSIGGMLGEYLNPPKAPSSDMTLIDKPEASPKQQLTQDQVKVVSAYTAAPKGSMARKVLLAQNPWLKTYWDANTQYYREHPIEAKGPLADYLKSVGVDPNTAMGATNTSSYGSKRGKKISLKKLSMPKQNASTPAPLHLKPIATKNGRKLALKVAPKRPLNKIKIKSLALS